MNFINVLFILRAWNYETFRKEKADLEMIDFRIVFKIKFFNNINMRMKIIYVIVIAAKLFLMKSRQVFVWDYPNTRRKSFIMNWQWKCRKNFNYWRAIKVYPVYLKLLTFLLYKLIKWFRIKRKYHSSFIISMQWYAITFV